jgi:hypothetical protein
MTPPNYWPYALLLAPTSPAAPAARPPDVRAVVAVRPQHGERRPSHAARLSAWQSAPTSTRWFSARLAAVRC